MRTPKKYLDSIDNGVITKEILVDCLRSVKERAKNCREKKTEYSNFYRTNYYYSKVYSTSNQYRYSVMLDDYLDYETVLLSVGPPDIIKNYSLCETDLLSMKFVKKVISLIESGNYKYVG